MWRTRFLTLRADVSAAVSRDAAKRLEDFYALGRGLVVPLVNGIADEDILPASPVRGDSQAVLKIIAVGKIGPRKAFDVLIKAAAKTENAEVVIFGDGSRDDLESLADQLGVADRLSFAGWSEHPPYEKFNVFVQTSQAESFGRALAEAMMAKLPVITTPVGDVGRVVEESKAGLVIPVGGVDELAAAMERLKSDVKFRNYLAEKGFELAKRNFTIERCVADHLRLWQQLLDQPRKSRLFVRHLKA